MSKKTSKKTSAKTKKTVSSKKTEPKYTDNDLWLLSTTLVLVLLTATYFLDIPSKF